MNLRLLLLTLAASLPILSIAQVGTGVVFYTDPDLAFVPTTVDSTSVISIELGNEVGVAQTVSLLGLNGPFSLVGPSAVTIESEASTTLNVSFSPATLGDKSDTLLAQGSVFGEAQIILSGEGIQVLLEWSTDTLIFDTTAIGATSTADLIITNVGNGTAAITDVQIDNDAFSVEFLDPYVAPTPQEPCYTIPANDYGGNFDVPYREFYLTVTGGAFPDELYCNIYDPWGAFSYEVYGAVVDYPVCLPDNWELPTDPNEYCCYNYFEFHTEHQLYNPVFTADMTFTLRDEWNNEVWSFDLGAWPDYQYSNQGTVTTGNPPAGPDFTPGLIGEGLSTIARVSMTPVNSGAVQGAMTLSNSSTNATPLTIDLIGAGVSEISGDFCGIWTAEDSPYSFTGTVRIPADCSLTIEPGTTVIQEGFNLEVLGGFSAEGTAVNPISMAGGDLYLSNHPDTAHISFLNRGQNEFTETIYLNTFDNQEMASEFNCFDETYGDLYEGSNSNGNGNYGCDDFDFNNGRLQFYSQSNHNGYIFPADTLFAPSSGEYEISADVIFYGYQFEASNKYLYLEIFGDNTWTAYDSIQSFQSGSVEHLLRAKAPFQSGDPILYRFRHEQYNSNGMDSRLDHVRVGLSRRKVQITPWDVVQQQDSLVALIEDYGYSNYIQILDSGVIDIQTGYYEWGASSSDYWETTLLDQAPILVESSGQYYCSVFSNTLKPEYYNDWYLQFRRNGSGSWQTVASYTNETSVFGIVPGWTESIAKLPFSLNPGDRIDFRVDPYINGSSTAYNEIDFQLKDISFFKLASGDILERPVEIENSVLTSLASSSFLGLDSVNLAAVELFDDEAKLDANESGFESIVGVAGNVLTLNECSVSGSVDDGIYLLGDNTQLNLFGCEIFNHSGSGIRLMGSNTATDITYSLISNNGESGLYQEQSNSGLPSEVLMNNSLVAYNGYYGLKTDGAVDINYSTILHNGNSGCRTSEFSTVTNSILWFNGYQLESSGSVYAVSYSNVQGINALLTNGAYAWGDGCLGTDPVIADSPGHLDPYSPCVDGGMPWEQDAHIPYGLGSSRADMGMYGGPANEYWGGQAPPDGAVVITDLFDIPQDQGGQLGIHFTASPFDFGGLGFNVTHYSIWRDLALGSDLPTVVGDGNWEQIGEVPAQGFSQYGYTAETLVDATPGDTTCLSSFIVIAHTTDDNIYWVSEVGAACSYDNLAPEAPELEGDVLMEDPDTPVVVLSWPAPEAEDYAYTVIERADGPSTNVVGDTLLLDTDVIPGSAYDYLGYHFDLNGNPSDTAYVTLLVGIQRDVIALSAGWNLISLDRAPVDASVGAVMADLVPGNLLYVTGFDAGATFYDPSGLAFLNTMSALEDGYGYWVKVAADDTLRVEGAPLPAGLIPDLDSGWNLVGYTAAEAASPDAVFADLLADDALEYVTGFDAGVSIYDPTGLPFLNSLTAMENGFGYWVKTSADFAGMAETSGARMGQPNPNYMVLNGTSNLGHHAGQTVAVVTALGEAVAELLILEGGHLMTTPVYGSGPAGIRGIAPGEDLYLEFNGERSEAVAQWNGGMEHVKLDVAFSEPEFSVFPNPAVDRVDIRWPQPKSGDTQVDILDAAGRLVLSKALGSLTLGDQQVTLSVSDLAPGTYQVRLTTEGQSIFQSSLHRTE